MSAVDLSFLLAATYTARTKRARLRVHRDPGQIYRSDAARTRNDPLNDAPGVFTSRGLCSSSPAGTLHDSLEKCSASTGSAIYIAVATSRGWLTRYIDCRLPFLGLSFTFAGVTHRLARVSELCASRFGAFNFVGLLFLALVLGGVGGVKWADFCLSPNDRIDCIN